VAGDELATFEVMRRATHSEAEWAQHVAMRRHLQTCPHSSFWVAEEAVRFGAPRIVGYARGIVRDRVWTLTEFNVLPDHHRKGIGHALLAACVADGDRDEAERRFILASQHPDADALYVRLCGCVPRLPMLLVSGQCDALVFEGGTQIEDAVLQHRRHTTVAASYLAAEPLIAEPIVPTPETLATFAGLDRQSVGFARPEEHNLWCAEMGGPSGRSRLFRRTHGDGGGPGEIVGYAYIGTAWSGPALATDPADLPRMISHAVWVHQMFEVSLERFGSTAPDRAWAISGTNRTMLNWLLSCRWQISFYYLYMSTHDPGNLDGYVCSNPLYLL
jgi:GNAT superfamily N-acetyltransferase